MSTIGSEMPPKEISLIPLVYLTRPRHVPFLRRFRLAQACFSALDREPEEVSYGPAQFCFDTGLLA
jgi:hypothetical protein